MDYISKKDLVLHDAPQIVWIKIEDAIKMLWDKNPKLHDLGGLAESIKLHGFQELPKMDSNLINVSKKKGAIKSGNGRIEALAWMEKDGRYELPRGLAKNKKDGAWVMPLLIGTDAESKALAESYAVDSNNLAMSGGNFTAYDQSRQWDQDGYMDVLRSIAAADNEGVMPITVDMGVLDHLTRVLPHGGVEPPEDFPDYDEDIEVEHRCPKCKYEWSGQPQ